jgi:hypothetical protein
MHCRNLRAVKRVLTIPATVSHFHTQLFLLDFLIECQMPLAYMPR